MKLFSIINKRGKRRTIEILGATLPWPFPVASLLGSSAAVVLGYPVYGANAPKYISKLFTLFYKIDKIKHYLIYRFHPAHQYHIIRTNLEPGYYDVDTIMLEACMKLLCRYVEDECGGIEELKKWTGELLQPGSEGHGPRQVVEHQAAQQSETLAIYHWWKVERPRDKAKYDELLHELYGNKRFSFKEVEGSDLHEMVVEDFKGDEKAMENEFRNLERKMEDDEQTMLHRLIDIRQGLWT